MSIGLIVVHCIRFYEELIIIYHNESYLAYLIETVP